MLDAPAADLFRAQFSANKPYIPRRSRQNRCILLPEWASNRTDMRLEESPIVQSRLGLLIAGTPRPQTVVERFPVLILCFWRTTTAGTFLCCFPTLAIRSWRRSFSTQGHFPTKGKPTCSVMLHLERSTPPLACFTVLSSALVPLLSLRPRILVRVRDRRGADAVYCKPLAFPQGVRHGSRFLF
jgi:hypothetical protein